MPFRYAAFFGIAASSSRDGAPGDRVGIRIPSGTSELYEGILGILHSGAAYVPVDADDPESRASWIWDECAVAAVLGPHHQLEIRRPAGETKQRAQVTDEAWVIFTSGSTGRPKGVAVSHRAAAAFLMAATARPR